MAKRLWVLLSVLTLFGCSARETPAPDLPKSISPGWRLASFGKADLASAPDIVKAAHPQAAWLGTYTGAGTAHVRVWAVSGATGLDLVQNWQAEPNTVVLYSDRYFTAVDWAGTDRVQAGALVRAIERAVGRAPGKPGE